MKVSKINVAPSFKRALTTKEKKEFEQVQKDAKQVLGLDKSMMTIFDFMFPSGEKDSGIGTSFSDKAQEVVAAMKATCGINAIQLQPQGQVSNYIRSPYSGTSFSLGEHLIDLTKLADEKYGSLLTDEDLDGSYLSETDGKTFVDYENVFAPDGQKAMLKKAYLNFRELPKTSELKRDFEQFKKDNSFWLEKDALYDACATDNGSEDMNTWSYTDQNVFATQNGNQRRIEELKQVEDENGINIVDYKEFVQFIADKQQKESRERFNKQGVDIYGDCAIGFSQKDFWAHKSAFYKNADFGCGLNGGGHSCWSPAIDLKKLDGEAGELLYNKFNKAFQRYDGVRVDAAWQLVKPLICTPTEYDQKGNKLGEPRSDIPEIGSKIIDDILLRAADENGIPHDKILLEMLAGDDRARKSLPAVDKKGMTLIHITRYGDEHWGRVKYYESKGGDPYQNMEPGDYIIGPGTHDDPTLLEQAENGRRRIGYLARDLKLNSYDLESSKGALADAIFAETYTTRNQFATVNDIIGTYRRINEPNTSKGNWTYRIGPDWEEEYHRNLTKGQGLNYADALAKAIKAKSPWRDSLVKKLEYFADILRKDGPMTTKEADEKFSINA